MDPGSVVLNGKIVIKIIRANKPNIWDTSSHGGTHGFGMCQTVILMEHTENKMVTIIKLFLSLGNNAGF